MVTLPSKDFSETKASASAVEGIRPFSLELQVHGAEDGFPLFSMISSETAALIYLAVGGLILFVRGLATSHNGRPLSHKEVEYGRQEKSKKKNVWKNC